ncbi:MAG: CBS domain-containing protein [Nitrospira sp.]|nr:CBS domain-containing protein [Nitrospira sp.]MDH4371084.1 CBS domain-containing protein [Nitrospira sp.]MDH5498725.1 CBS domain-containing protein [Nitrospira sp.]
MKKTMTMTKTKTKTKKVKVVKVKDFDSMTVSQVMEKEVQSVRLRTKGDVIASLMIEGFGAVPVVENGRKLAGIVSEHDLLAAVDDGHHLGTVLAKDIMTSNPYSVRPETTLGTLVHVLRASDLVRVPVVDEKDKLIGIIARRDVLRTYLATGGKRQE